MTSPFDPNVSIPNSPFYYPAEQGLRSISGILIVGDGLTIDYATGIISATGGGGGTTNLEVTSPITNSGTTANPNVGIQLATRDQLGAVQVGSNISVSSGTISVRFASELILGIVQLVDSAGSTSVLDALTANQGRVIQDQIDILNTTGGLKLAGTFDAATALMATVTASGSLAGFVVGVNLPPPVPSLKDFVVIVSQPGRYTPPGSFIPLNLRQGDWLVCDGLIWGYLNIGNQFPIATQTNLGLIELATQAEVNAETNTSDAVTPATLANSYISKSLLTARGALISASATAIPTSVPVGAAGLALTACSACTSGLTWKSIPLTDIPCSCITGKGSLLSGTGASAPLALSVGSNNQVLTINSACPLGIAWVTCTNTAIPCACIIDKGSIITGIASSAPASLPVGNDGQVLIACPTSTYGVAWASSSSNAIPCDCVAGPGSLITGTSPGSLASLSPGSDGLTLTACSACPLGLTWGSPPPDTVPCSCYTGKGTILGGTGICSLTALSPGSNGQILCVDDTTATGLAWNSPPYIPCSCITGRGALITGDSAGQPTALALGAESQVLIACSACPLGIMWRSNPINPALIPSSCIASKGSLIVGNCIGIPIALTAPSSNGQFLNFCISSGSCDFAWSDISCVRCSCFTSKGSLYLGCGNACLGSALPVGANGTTLMGRCQCTLGAFWGTYYMCGDTPVGAVEWFAMCATPPGWLVADGTALNRTSFSDLFAVIGTTFGAGDGTTTFNLPDLRGMWISGWDASGGCARNCDPNRVFGSTQAGAVQSHQHAICVTGGGSIAGVPEWYCPDLTSCLRCWMCASRFPGGGCSRQGGYTGANPTSPKNTVDNVALLPCIKHTRAIAGLSNNVFQGIWRDCLVQKGTIVTSQADYPALSSPWCQPVPVELGLQDQVFQVNSSCLTGNQWDVALTDGIDGQVLEACNACPLAYRWASPTQMCAIQCRSAFFTLNSSSCMVALSAPITTPGVYLVSINGCYFGNREISGKMCIDYGGSASVPPPDLPILQISHSNGTSGASGNRTDASFPVTLSTTVNFPPLLADCGFCFRFFVTNTCSNQGEYNFTTSVLFLTPLAFA